MGPSRVVEGAEFVCLLLSGSRGVRGVGAPDKDVQYFLYEGAGDVWVPFFPCVR